MKPTIIGPGSGKPIPLRHEERETEYHGETLRYTAWYYEDTNGDRYTTTESDEVTLAGIYSQWRERHRAPSPSDIMALRLRYGMPPSMLAAALDTDEETLADYEDSIPPQEAACLTLRSLERPDEALRVIAGLGGCDERARRARHGEHTAAPVSREKRDAGIHTPHPRQEIARRF